MSVDLHSKSRNELREALRRKGLSPSGVKEDLIRRLEGYEGLQASLFAAQSSRKQQLDSANDSHRSTDDEQASPTSSQIPNVTGSQSILLSAHTQQIESSSHQQQPQEPIPIPKFLVEETPICGHPNKYGKPCQRVGRYCPYHGVIKGAHQNQNDFATHRFKEFTKHVVESDPTYIPTSVSALPTTIEYSHTSSSVIGKRKVDNYNSIVDTLIHRPTKRFKHVDLSAEEIARQRFFQHAALEFERIREEQQHQLEVQQLQQQIEVMREKAQQKDKVIESLERCISEMDKNLLTNPDKLNSDDINRWKNSTQQIHDEQLKNIF